MGTTVTRPVRVVLDCDPGIDDAVAIAWAVAHPAIELVAVGTVWGNVDLARTTDNAVQVLDACGAGQVPVARGAAGPRGGGTGPASGHVHGTDGLGGLAMATPGTGPAATTAARQLVARCRADPGAIHVVALGPRTNLAEALDLEPDLPDLVAGVTLMGGAALVPGNVTPAAEANVFFDPLAARRVLAASWEVTETASVVADVETGDGPGRGATIFDLRGHARGAAPDDDAHVRVVLGVADGFADQVVDTLVGPS
ncbi:nucleoside hydrolase [Salsipaludibacter albus]|uniref:nucleoside hydrolase n=1 Tax=Salsipaludibacter albus TaxID=2849650 RepID=UPI001EE498AD